MLTANRFCILLCLCFSVPAFAEEAAPRPMSPIDMVELPRLSSALLSPDGEMLLFRRSAVNWEENNTVRRYRLVDLSTSEDMPLFEPEDEEESFGRGFWAPDSSGFITLLEREDDDYEQAYFFALETNTLTRLTDHDEDVESVRWAPDGEHFYFLATRAQDADEKHLRKNNWLIQDYEERRPKSIWRYSLDTGETKQIAGGDAFIRGYALSRDGSKIILTRAPGGLIDDTQRGELWLHDLASGDETKLTDNAHSESAARLAPDNQSFAFIATVDARGRPYYEDNLFVQKVGESKPRLLMADEAMEVVGFSWSKDGNGLYVLGNIGVRTELFFYSLESESLTRLTSGDHVIKDWRYYPDLDAHSAVIANAATPGEIYLMDDGATSFRQVTNEYLEWADRFLLPRQEVVHWRGNGRVQIEGLLAYPVGYQTGDRFPLVTITHGGPRSSSQFGSWNVSRYLPVLTGQGYGVLLPNHRGGTGYGDKFMRDMVGNYFRNSHHDVMDGIDALIERGLADPDRLIKMGWSAGGHMTNKLVTVTDRFKAASSGAGASDWDSMYAESDVRFNRTFVFGGAPWEKDAPLDSYASQSVLKDAWRVKTPTLFFAGARDVRVPPTQSIMLHRGLKAAGVETRLYLAPGEPHNFRKPSHQLFKMNTELAWYAHYALGEVFTPSLPDDAMKPDEQDEE